MRTHHRATAGLLVEAVGDDKLLRFADKDLKELVVNSVLYVHTRTRGAVLAGVVKDSEGRPIRRCVQGNAR